YTTRQIAEQLAVVGSKFYASFADSPQLVIDNLSAKFGDILVAAKWDDDCRCRMSFDLGCVVGSRNVVNVSELSQTELATIRNEQRGDFTIRVASSLRTFESSMCNLVVGGGCQTPQLITMFPGLMAPPLTANIMEDIFWSKHVFVQ
ncbi:MAG: hypothetical protein SNI57_05595, partial [Rikenellaceae bacterium]